MIKSRYHHSGSTVITPTSTPVNIVRLIGITMFIMLIPIYLLHTMFSGNDAGTLSSNTYLRRSQHGGGGGGGASLIAEEPPNLIAAWDSAQAVLKEFEALHPNQRVFEKITCPDGSIGYVNDDFCDCNDGSDELISSSCSYLKAGKKLYKCLNIKKTIFLSRINDGVKDCPEGDDEYVEQ